MLTSLKNFPTLNCSEITCIRKNDLFFIADCFPLLEELTLIEEFNPHCYFTISSSIDFVLADDDDYDDDDDRFLVLPKIHLFIWKLH